MDVQDRLSKIATLWTTLRAAQGPTAAAQAAQESILQRYAAAIHRYLAAALNDDDAADDLYQEFAVRFIAGAYAGADREKGRFRHYLKRVLHNLICDHYKALRRSKEFALDPNQTALLPETRQDEAERAFRERWQMGLMSRTWTTLRAWQDREGLPYYTVLRCRVENLAASSTQLAALVSELLNKPISDSLVRNHLCHARKTFAKLLVAEVRATLLVATDEALSQELIELGLWEQCKGAIG